MDEVGVVIVKIQDSERKRTVIDISTNTAPNAVVWIASAKEVIIITESYWEWLVTQYWRLFRGIYFSGIFCPTLDISTNTAPNAIISIATATEVIIITKSCLEWLVTHYWWLFRGIYFSGIFLPFPRYFYHYCSKCYYINCYS